jgi:prepilin-type N-terminal cleavage/methylation domain-containing protein
MAITAITQYKNAKIAYRGASMKRGVTLVEVMVVLAASLALMTSIVFLTRTEADLVASKQKSLAERNSTIGVEDALCKIFEGARLTTSTSDNTSYFESKDDGNSSTDGADRVTLTTTAPSVPLAAYYDSADSETQNTTRGPLGSCAEVSIGIVAAGDAGGKTGLFERLQRTSDADLTQGGNEFLISDQIDSIHFEFWDGEEWQTTWDTLENTRRLPQSVQVTYTLKSDINHIKRVFVAPIPTSDVNAFDIYTSSTSSTSSSS